MQAALDAGFPKTKKFVEHRKTRRQVKRLPNEALQELWVIRHMVENLGRR
jgi:hypothetical protein